MRTESSGSISTSCVRNVDCLSDQNYMVWVNASVRVTRVALSVVTSTRNPKSHNNSLDLTRKGTNLCAATNPPFAPPFPRLKTRGLEI